MSTLSRQVRAAVAAKLSPLPLSGKDLDLYVEREVDREYSRLLEEELSGGRAFLSVFVEAARGFGKTTSANYWSRRILPRLGYRPIRIRTSFLVDALYESAVKAIEHATDELSYRVSTDMGAVDLITEVSRLHDRLQRGEQPAESVAVLLKLDEMLGGIGARIMVLVDDFSAWAPDAKIFLQELDHLLQEPRAIFFTIFGTPRDLSRVALLARHVYEKMTVVRMPHFTQEEAKEAVRRRVEAAGGRFEDFFAEEDFALIYAMSTGPRELLALAREYVRLGGNIRAVMGIREREVLRETYELLDDTDRAILRFMREREAVRLADLRRVASIPDPTLYYRLRKLREMGFITRLGRGIYSLTRSTEELLDALEGRAD
ncbi:MAG: winged helix-turn-helix domain-containing protein [Candidatus Korarchaeota archaeon]|nr:winged helix-turn-helix domain-containing protein [Candidatus Korarchaeota archaeon]